MYFIDYFGKDYSALDNLTKSMMITRTIVLAIDISVTIAFSTIGIKKLVQSRKNQSEINNAYKYLSIVLASKVLTSMMLINTQAGTFAGYSDNLSKLIFGCAFHLYVCLAFDTFLFFKKGQISIFIARIILSFGLFIPLIVIGSFNDSYLYFASTNEGFIYHFVKMIVEMNSDASYISSFVLTSFSLACIFIIVTICYFIVTFFTSSYFGGMNRFKRFRIIFYMSTITLSIISTMFMISSIIEANLYGAYLNTPVKNSVAPYIAFVMSFLLVGVSIATFNIYNRANRREKLAEKTTIK